MHILTALLAILLLAGSAAAQQLVSFPTQDGGIVYADLCGGEGERGVALAQRPFHQRELGETGAGLGEGRISCAGYRFSRARPVARTAIEV